jgi:hypothetical protein
MLICYARVGLASEFATDNASKTAGRRRIFTPTSPATQALSLAWEGEVRIVWRLAQAGQKSAQSSSRRWPSSSARVSGSEPDGQSTRPPPVGIFYIFRALTEFETNVITDRMVAGRQAGRKTRPGLNGGPNRCSSGPDLGRA